MQRPCLLSALVCYSKTDTGHVLGQQLSGLRSGIASRKNNVAALGTDQVV
jgi:hypothetical protein